MVCAGFAILRISAGVLYGRFRNHVWGSVCLSHTLFILTRKAKTPLQCVLTERVCISMGKTLRIIRITKLLRLARLERALSKMNMNIGPLIRGVTIVVVSVMCFHMFGCIWHWAGSSEAADESGDIVEGWVNSSVWTLPGESITTGLYTESVFRSMYGAVSLPATITEMAVLII
eukprot:SAG31_NODE_13399_length_872_cov_1.082794_1_plen_173_part_10